MKKLQGFSLAEMMIVLLIVAIILAATAPIVSRKLSKQSRVTAGLWEIGDNSYYKASRINGNPRFYMNTGNNGRISLSSEKGNHSGSILFGNNTVGTNLGGVIALGFETNNLTGGTIAIGNSTEANNGIAIGHSAKANNTSNNGAWSSGSIAIGSNATAGGGTRFISSGLGSFDQHGGIAIGTDSKANDVGSIAIGKNAHVKGDSSVSTESADYGIAIGENATAEGNFSTVLGNTAKAEANYSTAIGYGAKANREHTIVLGTSDDTVIIPGRMLIGSTTGNVAYQELLNVRGFIRMVPLDDSGDENGTAIIGVDKASGDGQQLHTRRNELGVSCTDTSYCQTVGRSNGEYGVKLNGKDYGASYTGPAFYWGGKDDDTSSHRGIWNYWTDRYTRIYKWDNDFSWSDIRLKNVGEKYTYGLDALKKLELYNYTYKNDETKAPHVGVIAQDLQKVFPNSVITDTSGYLKIRWDEMFYAIINAVKELDVKIDKVVADVTGLSDKIEQQQKTIDAQQKSIEDLTARIEKLEK